MYDLKVTIVFISTYLRRKETVNIGTGIIYNKLEKLKCLSFKLKCSYYTIIICHLSQL